MSRLFDSLQKAEQQRRRDATETDPKPEDAVPRLVPEPSYFWSSLIWLVLILALILVGFSFLAYQLYGTEPLQGLQQLFSYH